MLNVLLATWRYAPVDRITTWLELLTVNWSCSAYPSFILLVTPGNADGFTTRSPPDIVVIPAKFACPFVSIVTPVPTVIPFVLVVNFIALSWYNWTAPSGIITIPSSVEPDSFVLILMGWDPSKDPIMFSLLWWYIWKS